MKVGIYARVSTRDKGQDINMQLSELQSYCEARQWVIFNIYKDDGMSGSKSDRPAFISLLNDARQRKFDTVLVWKLDRFSRSLKDLCNTITELHELKIDFVSLKDNLDFTTSAGKLMFHIIGAFSEFERDIIRERVKAGLANAVRKGKKLGRKGLAPIDRRKIIELQGQGKLFGRSEGDTMSLQDIAHHLKVSKSVVHKTLVEFRHGKLDKQGFYVNEK